MRPHTKTSREQWWLIARIALLAPITVVIGCGGDRASPETIDNVASSPDSATLAWPEVVTSQLPAPTALVALTGDGLMLVSSPSGASRALEFNTPASQVLRALSTVLGKPGERSTNHECGMGPLDFVSFGDELMIVIQNDQFLGWTVQRGGANTMRTMSNIGLGSTRAELQGTYNADIARSTLGIEFMAGGLQGILASDVATAPITDLWAGANCVAR